MVYTVKPLFQMEVMYGRFFQSDVIEKLNMLSDFKCCDDIDANDDIGLMYNFTDKQNFHTIIGDFVQI